MTPEQKVKDAKGEKKGKAKPADSKKTGGSLAVIRIRGIHKIKGDIGDTLTSLRLYRKNYCVVIPDAPSTRGMLQKAKDYITWGEVDKSTQDLLVSKRGEEYKGPTEGYNKRKFIEVKGKKLKPYFRLAPPTGGFARKGIKRPASIGGVLGYRGDKINALIQRMVR